jgi:hypothetical protein
MSLEIWQASFPPIGTGSMPWGLYVCFRINTGSTWGSTKPEKHCAQSWRLRFMHLDTMTST